MTKVRKAQTEKFHFHKLSRTGNKQRRGDWENTEGRERKRGVFTNTSKVFIWKDGNVLDGERDSLALWTHKSHGIDHYKIVHFILLEFTFRILNQASPLAHAFSGHESIVLMRLIWNLKLAIENTRPGWGAGWVDKGFTVQVWGSEFWSPEPTKKQVL